MSGKKNRDEKGKISFRREKRGEGEGMKEEGIEKKGDTRENRDGRERVKRRQNISEKRRRKRRRRRMAIGKWIRKKVRR